MRVYEPCAHSVENMAVSISPSNSSSFGHVLSHQSDTNNILKLKLKKPKSWNWELSTSKSSAHIDFPRVLLYDKNDRLLADVEEANFIVNGKENPMPMHSPHSTESNDRNRTARKSNSFCVSSSSTKSSLKSPPIIKFVDSDSHSCDNDIAVNVNSSNSNNSYKLNLNPLVKIDNDNDDNVIDSHNIPNDDDESEEETSQLPIVPILIYSAKGLIQRDFNAKEFDGIRNRSNSQKNIKLPESAAHSTDNGVSNTNKTQNKLHSDNSQAKHLQVDKNPLIKCNSMAEMLANQLVRTNSRRIVRRTKSSASTKHSFRNALPLSSSSSTLSTTSLSVNQRNQCNSTNNKKPTYYTQKSAAGTLIIPEITSPNGKEHRHRRRRRLRSHSHDGIERASSENNREKSENNYPLKYKATITSSNSDTISNPMDMSPVDETICNQLNGNASFCAHIACTKRHNNKNRNKHSTSIKNENETCRLSAQNGSIVSLANSNNHISNSNSNTNNSVDTKQRKVQQQQQQQQIHRKVSFVQVNDNDTMHNRIQETNEFNQNEKCISTIKSSTGRRKKVHGKIKKSASIAGYYCRNHTMAAMMSSAASLAGDSERKSASDTDDYDFSMKPPMRHKKRRVAQRPRSSLTTTTSSAIAANATSYHSKSIVSI